MPIDTAVLNIYTPQGVLTFEVEVTGAGFDEQLANSLEEGTPFLTTVEGNTLILNGMNYVAIEIIRNVHPPG